ncbi:MAG: LysR family transcriptional regulator [Bifidobacteriaceae bacterium]|nr:LysR family transcriptional regulator [Bifidobacteriaceae bacterium]
MKIEYLVEFADLADSLSYTETARRLWLTESSLSRHIKSIEEELGVALFERTSRRVRLSPYGQALVPHARQIAGLWEAYLKDLRAAKARDTSTVLIASNYYINDLVAYFCAKNPGMSVRQVQRDDSTAALLAMLDRGECQIVAVIADEVPAEQVESLVLATDTYVAVLPAGHPLAGATAIRPEDLAGEHFISFKLDTEGDRQIKAICRRASFEPNVIMTADVGSAAARFVRDGLGVTFLQSKTIAKMDVSGVACLPLAPPVGITVRLGWKLDTPLPPAAQAFLAYVRAQLALEAAETATAQATTTT